LPPWAKGDVYTARCAACGRDNGRRVASPDLPAIPPTPGRCAYCGSRDTAWAHVGRND
jgi:DNA-directed RNA polymerase subunit RPC12/RpoP